MNEVAEKRVRQKKNDKNYVNNKEFTAELDKYSQECRKAVEDNKQEPRMSRYLGECIIKMAERLALLPRFRGYAFREDMVGNAIVAAVRYAKNFDGSRFDNGFAYITQILFSHMVITIKNEKKKYQTNIELIQQAELSAFGNPEIGEIADSHARAIADQKMRELEESKIHPDEKNKGGFKLRTGTTKEERAKAIGTPMQRG